MRACVRPTVCARSQGIDARTATQLLAGEEEGIVAVARQYGMEPMAVQALVASVRGDWAKVEDAAAGLCAAAGKSIGEARCARARRWR